MVSTGKAVLKIAQYKFGSNPLDTVVRAKVRKTAQAISDPALILAVYFENAPVFRRNKTKSRGNNRGYFELTSRLSNSAQKYANFALDQGINTEFCEFLRKPQASKDLPLFSPGFKKLTGNHQGIFAAVADIFPQPAIYFPSP
jgi:hypothetical protein